MHPREVDAHFSHGTVTNYWGGSSNATTHLLEELHYRGWLRVARRERGIRIYAFRDPVRGADLSPRQRVDALVDVVVNKYAPLPALSLSVCRPPAALRRPAVAKRTCPARSTRARRRLAHADVDGVDWYWPDGESRNVPATDDDRSGCSRRSIPSSGTAGASSCSGAGRIASRPTRRWRSASSATTHCRCCGASSVIGWANLAVVDGDSARRVRLRRRTRRRTATFARELDAELARFRALPATRLMPPMNPSERLASVDLLRGIVMVIMALDHVREYVHAPAQNFNAEDLAQTTAAIFFTRWITHFCAPVFAFCAGLGAWFWPDVTAATRAELSRFLWTRGLWLIVLEFTVVRLGFFFNFDHSVALPAGVLDARR